LWVGHWDPSDESNEVTVNIENGADVFKVVFLSEWWFVATKGDNPYRLGKRI